MWAKVDNHTIGATVLPVTGVLSDGRKVSGYHLLPPAILQAEGWTPVTDDGPPEHDETTHQTIRELSYVNGDVVATYTIVERPQPPPLAMVLPGDHADPVIGAIDA